MRNRRVEIAQALTTVATALAHQLAPGGWQLRSFSTPNLTVFTRPIGEAGLLSVVEVAPTNIGPNGPYWWPVRIGVRFGCGYEPATALMPLVTLAPRGILVEEPIATDGPDTQATLTGAAGEVRATATRLARIIGQHETAFEQRITTIKALDEALIEGTLRSAGNDRAVERRLLLLASFGRLDLARKVLDKHLAAVPARPSGRPFRPLKQGVQDASAPFRRFARQLDRWLEAGGPPIPPVETTLALLPPVNVRPRWPRRARRRQIDRATKAARLAIRPVAAGKTRAELAALLSAALETRGLVDRQLGFDLITVEQDLRSFRRARHGLYTTRLLLQFVARLTSMVRHGVPVDPEWLHPPEQAGWEVGISKGGRRWSMVELYPDVQPFLARIAIEAGLGIGPLVVLEGWLTEQPSAEPEDTRLVVNLGGRPVGTLSTQASLEFGSDVLAARTMYDELVRVRLNLVRPDQPGSALLEVRLPCRPAEDSASGRRQGLRTARPTAAARRPLGDRRPRRP